MTRAACAESLLEGAGHLNTEEFEEMMRRQMMLYTQVRARAGFAFAGWNAKDGRCSGAAVGYGHVCRELLVANTFSCADSSSSPQSPAFDMNQVRKLFSQ